MIKILNTSNETLAILQNTVSPLISEELNREFIFNFTTVIDNDKSSHVNYQNKVEVEDNYFNIVYTEEERTQDGVFVHAQCEHVSYDLLSIQHTAGFTAIGDFATVAALAIGTASFTVGTVASTATETISILEATNARQILISLAALHGGEIEWDKYTINEVAQRGTNRGVQFRYRKNLVGVKRITDNRTKTDAGLPTISYQISPAELEFEQNFIDAGIAANEHYELGDTVRVVDEDLGIDAEFRIVKESHDTKQRMVGQVEIANFVEDLTDGLTRIQTTTVSKDNVYNGCSIGPDLGFAATRSDNLARAIMNATDGIKIQKGDGTGTNWIDVIYLDTSGNATFTGFVLASQFIGGSILIGGTAFETAPFSVTTSGAATADNLFLTGAVITIGSGSETMRFNATDGLWLGATSAATAPFSVTMSGSLTAYDLTLLGGLFNIGTGTETLQFNTTDGIFLGNTAAASAPFHVTMSGSVTATDLNMQGGNITGGTLTITSDATVGNNLYLGSATSSDTKQIKFNNTVTIQNYIDDLGSPPVGLELSAHSLLLDDVSYAQKATSTGTFDFLGHYEFEEGDSGTIETSGNYTITVVKGIITSIT